MDVVREVWGSLIKEHRRLCKLTQADLAELLGVSVEAVSSWERGLRSPTPDVLVACVQQLHIEPRDLFDIVLPVASAA